AFNDEDIFRNEQAWVFQLEKGYEIMAFRTNELIFFLNADG
ncbi:uncharacterized protein METZ01_LOCUS177173, partial [marine metagenome]